MSKRIFLTLALLTLFVGSVFGQRQTVFQTSFEYGSDVFDEPAVFEPADLNGADDQVGSWAGDEIPDAVGGDINIPPEATAGFVNNPYGGRALLMDRPGPNADGENFRGTLDATLSDSILLLGAKVSFEVGTRRTNGNNNKDYDIIGLGSDGSESFRVRVGTNNNGFERLGYVSDGSVVFDLPTTVGEDRAADLNNTGYNRELEGPFQDILGGPGVDAEFPLVTLSLGGNGYTIDLAHQPENTSGEANAYKSATLPYNGSAADLAVVQFEYRADSATGSNTGWFLDNVQVTGFEEIVVGDFDGDGSVGFPDFLLLANNFGTNNSEGDFDFSGTVDLNDWLGFKAAYAAAAGAGEPVAAASVPEPSSSVLLVLGSLVGMLVRRRRR